MDLITNPEVYETGRLYASLEPMIIYPTKAAALDASFMTLMGWAKGSAVSVQSGPNYDLYVTKAVTYWSRELCCTIKVSKPKETFLFLDKHHFEHRNVKGKDYKTWIYLFLFAECQGWVLQCDGEKIATLYNVEQNERWMKNERI